MNAHDFTFPALDGQSMLPLGAYAGGPLLVVNTASACGLTPQYAGLQKLWQTYGGRGLTVLGVPSNDFGAQEPGSETEIAQFCTARYQVSFPMTAKQTVLGAGAHPFYRWAVEQLGEAGAPRWNFHKYLIGPDGELVEMFGSRTPPQDASMIAAIEPLLAR
jgi:glutathione peroxidase